MERQPSHPSSCPPMSGPTMGAMPSTSIMRDIMRALSCGGKLSRITASAITIPAQAPTAWRKRSSVKTPMEVATAQPTEAHTYSASPMSSRGRRP